MISKVNEGLLALSDLAKIFEQVVQKLSPFQLSSSTQIKTNKNDRREKSTCNKQGGKFNDRMSYLLYRATTKQKLLLVDFIAIV